MGRKELALCDLTEAGEATLRSIVRLRLSDESTERVLILLATLVEVHVAKTLRVLVGLGGVDRSRFESALVADVEENMYMSWPSMWKWLSLGFDLQIQGAGPAQSFDSCIDVRNAIIHGYGMLTEVQSRNFGSSISLRSNANRRLGVQFIGNRVVVGERTRELALLAARDFTLYFDAQLLIRYPGVRTLVKA